LARTRYFKGVKIAISAAVGLFGLGWFIERVFGLSFMPI
jgi:hypothetical protein